MVDPGNAIGAGLVAWASKDLITKLLGPTAEYLGKGLQEFAERRAKNLNAIILNAAKKVGPSINDSQSVNPRIFRHILEEGQFCEDEVFAEYYGGLLASSRSPDGSDDRALPLLEVIKALSSFQIRTHYVFCHLLKQLCEGSPLSITLVKEREQLKIFLPLGSWASAVGVGEYVDPALVLSHVMHGLGRLALIDRNALWANNREFLLGRGISVATSPGIVYMLEPFGAELMLWVSGLPNVSPGQFLRPWVKLVTMEGVVVPSDAVWVSQPAPAVDG